MLNDDEYTDEELAGLNTWFQLVHENLPEHPFKFYFTKIKSGSPESDRLFKDPRGALSEGVENLAPLAGINEATTINTTIFGHHRTLDLRLIYIVVAVDAQDNSASITSHKALTRSDG